MYGTALYIKYAVTVAVPAPFPDAAVKDKDEIL
jgi:hypothetical protein